MANTTNFNWETPDDTDLVKDGAAAIRTLGQAIDTSLQDLEGGTTGQVLSKTSNTDMDFTWVTTDDANAIQNAIVDAKGDIIAASANDTPARLAVGTNDHRLVAASGEATGLKYVADTQNTVIDAEGDLLVGDTADTIQRLAIGTAGQVLTVDTAVDGKIKWATAASGGGMTLIQETVANADTGIVFGSIPGTYKQLLLVWTGIYHSGLGNAFALRFNNSSASEYANQTWGFANTSVDNESSISTNLRFKGGAFGEDTTSQTANNTVTANLYIDNYASTTKHKTYYGYKSNDTNGTRQNQTVVGAWGNTAAITSLDIVRIGGAGTISNIANTSIRLYGIS
jgi:hypothetical protein